MKSSKHVETSFVRANNDFEDKLTVFRTCLVSDNNDLMINQPTFTAFYMKNNFWTKFSKNGHCDSIR